MTKLTACPMCNATEISVWSTAKDYEYFSTPATYTYIAKQNIPPHHSIFWLQVSFPIGIGNGFVKYLLVGYMFKVMHFGGVAKI